MTTLTDQQVTIRFTGQQAQIAAAGVQFLISAELETAPQPWNEIGPMTSATFDAWITELRASFGFYADAVRQFEQHRVVDFSTARMRALIAVRERTGDTKLYGDPKPPTTGDVTVTWSRGGFVRLAAHLTRDPDDEDYAYELPVGVAILKQLEED